MPVLCLWTGANWARPVNLGRDQRLERVKVLIHRNLVFSPEEAGVISPSATVCLDGDVLEIPCVPFVPHSPADLSHCVIASADCLISPLETIYKMLGFLISLLGIQHSLYKTSWAHLFYLLSSLRCRTFHLFR